MSVRVERVASALKEEIGTFFQRHFTLEQDGFMTVTEVRLTADLKHARVFVSIFGDADRKKAAFARIENEKSYIRSAVAHNMSLRFVPDLTFVLDESMDRAMNLEKIIHKIQEERKEREGNGGTTS